MKKCMGNQLFIKCRIICWWITGRYNMIQWNAINSSKFLIIVLHSFKCLEPILEVNLWRDVSIGVIWFNVMLPCHLLNSTKSISEIFKTCDTLSWHLTWYTTSFKPFSPLADTLIFWLEKSPAFVPPGLCTILHKYAALWSPRWCSLSTESNHWSPMISVTTWGKPMQQSLVQWEQSWPSLESFHLWHGSNFLVNNRTCNKLNSSLDAKQWLCP